jgi:hypothetical protein
MIGVGGQSPCTEHVPSEYQRLYTYVSYPRPGKYTKVRYPKNIDNQNNNNANKILSFSFIVVISHELLLIQNYENDMNVK